MVKVSANMVPLLTENSSKPWEDWLYCVREKPTDLSGDALRSTTAVSLPVDSLLRYCTQKNSIQRKGYGQIALCISLRFHNRLKENSYGNIVLCLFLVSLFLIHRLLSSWEFLGLRPKGACNLIYFKIEQSKLSSEGKCLPARGAYGQNTSKEYVGYQQLILKIKFLWVRLFKLTGDVSIIKNRYVPVLSYI